MQLLTFAPRLNLTATTLDIIARLIGRNHFPSKRPYEGRGSHRASRKKICRVCYARGIHTATGGHMETTWVCETCPTVPGLFVEKVASNTII